MSVSLGGARRAVDRLIEWSSRAAPPKHAYAIAALLGLTTNLIVFGLGHVLGTSPYWDLPQEDSRAYLMGYRYFLHEPWHWPPFIVHTMNLPYPKSIAFTDSIPLWAAVNKAIATVIPPWGRFSERAYLGTWHVVVYVLQACFGVANLRALGRTTYANTIVGALFLLAVPPFAIRYGHASLEANFLILWALYLYFRTPAHAPRSWQLSVASVSQLAAAALINPYHVATSFAVFVVSLLKTRHLRTILIWMPLGLASVGLAAALAGFFSGEAKVPMGGFDQASSNVLSPFIPVRSGLVGDGRFIANVTATDYQYEGYAYLGLGVLVLLAAFLPRLTSVRATIARHPFLFLLALGTWLFSLSNHIYFGSHRIVSFEFPASLAWVAQQYRSPGRFVWLAGYVLILFLLRWGMGRFDRGWQRVVLPLLAVVQLADTSGDWGYVRGYTRTLFPHHLDLDSWRTLIHAHEAVQVHPPYDCIFDGPVRVDHLSQEIEFLASERTLPINGVYSARPARDCAAEARLRDALKPDERTLYVLLPQAVGVAPRLVALGASCSEFAFGQVCSKRTAALDAARNAGALRGPLPVLRLAMGEKLFLGANGNASFLQGSWSWAEPNGRWTGGASAGVVFRLEGAVPAQATLKLESGVVLCDARKTAEVDVLLDGVLLSTLLFTETTNDPTTPRSIPIAAPAALVGRPLLLELAPRDVRSPRALGCGNDDRKLGVWIGNLWFD